MEDIDENIPWRQKLRTIETVIKFRPDLAAIIVVTGMMAAVLEGIGLSFLYPIIEVAQSDGSLTSQGGVLGAFVTVYDFVGLPLTLETIIAGAAVVVILRYVVTFLSAWMRATLQTKYVRHMQTVAFENSLNTRVSYFDTQGSDEILNAIVTQARYSGRLIQRLSMLINQALLTVIYLVLAFVLAPRLTLLTIGVLGVFLYILRSVLESGYSVGGRVANANERVQEAVQAGTQGIRDVKLFNLSGELFSNFDKAAGQYETASIKLQRNKAVINNAYRLAAALTVFGLIYAAFVFSSLSLAGLGVFLMAMFRLAPRLSSLNDLIYQAEGDLPHLIRTQQFVEALEQRQEPQDGSEPVPATIEEVAFEDVYFAYEESETVLEGLSFTASRGEFLAFVGSSGAGKSTIVSLLARMYVPNRGRITANDRPISSFDLEEWREQVSVVRQNPFIFNDSLRYNVTVGNRDATESEIREVCEAARVTEFLDDLPKGLDTVLGDDGVRLSGGQRQRIAIARALLKDAEVLVLDEATSDLDTTLESEVHSNIEAMSRDHVMIVIAHRLSTVKNADCIYTMKNGRVIEAGEHAELVTNDGKYAELYATQS
ncbi:ABC transporter ATP-binding protein [Halorussus litoreus]|uniref:ABC transporter ATP-binding protein n=1 Tax=Halorussus litoreus TaxID=1710536 RepID=UPI000E25E71F|nr:ABC transporter ATP-binding protein [Halorussus litoreus]